MRSPFSLGVGPLALALCVLAGGLAPGAVAQTTYGTLDNFDVINDTGGVCHGFEIELEGISPSDVAYTFGAPYERYGDPAVVTTATGVIIRYSASYSGGTWSATTPFTGPPYLPTQGHSCWTGGVADPAEYYAAGCDHFGASLNAAPTATHYRWLIEGAVPGTLTPFGSQVVLPAPAWNVTPAGPGGQPIAAAVIAPPPPDAFEFGDALWAKVFVTELPDGLHPDDLDHMVIDDPDVDMVPDDPIEVEIEWVLLQASVENEGEQEFGGGVEVGAGNDAVSRRFEFYTYTGFYDANHEARCDDPLDPAQQTPDRCGTPGPDGTAGVGEIMGAHNVAINLVGLLPVSNQDPVAAGDVAATNEDFSVAVDVLGNDSDADGDSLTVTSVQDATNGTVALVGGGPVFSPDANYNGMAGFTYTVADGHGGMATGSVEVTVVSVNDVPVANPDTASTDEDVALALDAATLLGNDTDVDGDALTIASVQDAVHGTVALVGGSALFTPALNYYGAAGFTYTVDDGNDGMATAPVDVTVVAVNDVPVADAGPSQTVPRRATVRLDGTGSWDVESGASVTYAWRFVSLPRHSRATLSDPASAQPTFVADKRGVYLLGLVVNDGALESAEATVTITATAK